MTQKLSKEIFQTKYMVNGESSVDEVIDGVSLEIARAETSAKDVIKWRAIFSEEIKSGRILPAGRILANARSNPKMPYYNNCFKSGTSILTSKGLVPIEKVKIGDLVLTHTGRWKPVTNTIQNYVSELIDVYTSNKLTAAINVTKEHPFYQGDDEWAESKDTMQLALPYLSQESTEKVIDILEIIEDHSNITWDDHYIYTKRTQCNRFIKFDDKLAYVLGVFVGDGSTYKTNRGYSIVNGFNICFNQKDIDNLKLVRSIIEEYFGVGINLNITGNNWHYLRVSNYVLAQFFRNLSGESSLTKKVPEIIWTAGKKYIEAFLKGYISADAYISPNKSIQIGSPNEHLMKELQTLFHMTGKIASLSYIENIGPDKKHYSYRVYVSNYSSTNNLPKGFKHSLDQKNLLFNNFEKTAEPYKGIVYNLTVKDDESYIANNIVTHNCYTIGIEDSMDSITKAISDYMTIQKTGGGVGFNISTLRPKEFPIKTGGVSSGPLSFAEIFNTAATTISSAGGRRGATMLMLDCDHPDVEQFITYKRGDENKKLTQMNISVVVTDEFMRAAENDEPWNLKHNGVVVKTVSAKELMDSIISNNFDYAEPGIMFKTTANKVNNIHWDKSMEMIVTNP